MNNGQVFDTPQPSGGGILHGKETVWRSIKDRVAVKLLRMVFWLLEMRGKGYIGHRSSVFCSLFYNLTNMRDGKPPAYRSVVCSKCGQQQSLKGGPYRRLLEVARAEDE